MFRTIVDHMRDLELFHQSLTAADEMAWETDLSPNLDCNEQLLDSKWAAFIAKESLKLSLYALVFLDFHIFKVCNLRPMISSIELGWELPHAATLWEASTSKAWLARLYQDGCGAVVSFDATTTKYAFQGSATKSLALATQSLLSGSPCPHLAAALAASPFAALCAAATVDALVQDFTRCYYQLPPSLSDPSLFHILTQAQNKNVAAALRAIADARTTALRGAAADADADGRGSSAAGLWGAVHLVVASVKASLCVPDDLLIGGIVDNGVAAGLATHAHLTLGSYFASRRSAMQQQQQQQQHLSGGSPSELDAAGSLGLLGELMPALGHVVEQSTADTVFDEGPWVAVVTIRLLITVWKTLRLVVEYVRRNMDSAGESSFDPAGVTLRAVTRTVEGYIRRLTPDHALDTMGNNGESQEMDLGYHERCILLLAGELCKRRPVWPVGPALATVFDEIMTAIV
ncbi:putative c6 transcription factor [Diplodia seriata]|uniref:Putative c6 transcription factor n=1 Tax=Diplodia seriata TaxID=420778 RepID=A0A0G2HH36_9PEZI|nr:putative c6 transcription factor [Diplodia seriata]